MIKQFEVGKTYAVCGNPLHQSVTILKRTEKSVWFKNMFGKVVRRSIKVYANKCETFDIIHNDFVLASIER